MTTIPLRRRRLDLLAADFVAGKRDRRLNTATPGAYMVTEREYRAYHLPTVDAGRGPQCIVGDDLEALINEAWETWL